MLPEDLFFLLHSACPDGWVVKRRHGHLPDAVPLVCARVVQSFHLIQAEGGARHDPYLFSLVDGHVSAQLVEPLLQAVLLIPDVAFSHNIVHVREAADQVCLVSGLARIREEEYVAILELSIRTSAVFAQ